MTIELLEEIEMVLLSMVMVWLMMGSPQTVNELEASKAYTISIEPVPPATEIPRTSTNFITITGLNNASTPITCRRILRI